MEGQGGDHLPSPEKADKEVLIPRGEVILGSIDPRTLTREEFHNSPDLLFHGAHYDFPFSQDVDYQQKSFPNSSTLGNGFYTTPRRGNAEIYAKGRNTQTKGEGRVIEVLPYQARMLDLRAPNGVADNAPLPQQLFTEYVAYIAELDRGYYENLAHEELLRNNNLRSEKESFRLHLNNVFQLKNEKEPVDIRELMGGREVGEPRSKVGDAGAYYFTKFMLERQNYDGVIAYEDGDYAGQKDETSVVFYDAKKVGTYDAWHPEEPVQVSQTS